MSYDWIKKLAEEKKKDKKGKDMSDYLDEEKMKKTKKSFSNRFEELKKKIKGK